MMSLPAAIVVACIMVPGDAVTDMSQTDPSHKYHSTMDAMARGTEDGLKIYLQIIAMLIVTVAIVAIVNSILGHFPAVYGEPLTLQRILGWLFAPVVWLYGVPWREAVQAGSLLGVKTILNEFIAYSQLAALPARHLRHTHRADHGLLPMRLRQFRKRRHPDRRLRYADPGTSRRDRAACDARHHFRYDGKRADRRDDRVFACYHELERVRQQFIGAQPRREVVSDRHHDHLVGAMRLGQRCQPCVDLVFCSDDGTPGGGRQQCLFLRRQRLGHRFFGRGGKGIGRPVRSRTTHKLREAASRSASASVSPTSAATPNDTRGSGQAGLGLKRARYSATASSLPSGEMKYAWLKGSPSSAA